MGFHPRGISGQQDPLGTPVSRTTVGFDASRHYKTWLYPFPWPCAELLCFQLCFAEVWQLPGQVRYTLGSKHEAGAWLSFLHKPDCFTVHTTDWWCLLPSQLSCKRLTGPSNPACDLISVLTTTFFLNESVGLGRVISGTKFTQQN